MQQLIRENYRSHPKFKFNNNELKLSNHLLEDFNSCYGDPHGAITPQNFNQSVEKLDAIFESLTQQSIDDLHRIFLNELHFEVLNLMRQDFEFRKRLKPSASKNDLADALRESDHFFGRLSEPAVSKILNLAAGHLEKFRENAAKGKMKRSDLSVNSGRVPAKIARILDSEFRSAGIFKAVSEFVGIDYRFTGLSLELSVEGSTWWKDNLGNEQPPKTMYAHLDESIFAPKSIVYLSDVESSNGPTSLYPGAYREFNNNPLQDLVGRVVGRVGDAPSSPLKKHYEKSYHQSVGSIGFREHFMSLPEEIRFNSHCGWEVLPNSELEESLASREVEMLGPKGTYIVFDGSNLLHRGGLIEKGERLVLQVVFYAGTRFTHRARLAIKKLKQLLGGR